MRRQSPSFHEDLRREHAVKASTDRAFGLTVGGILLAIAALRWLLGYGGRADVGLAVAGVPLVVLGLVAPALLAPLNRAWTRLGLLLFKVVNPLVLAAIFVTTVVPIGLIMRVLGKDPLRRRLDAGAASYWILRQPPGPAPQAMKDQF